MIITCPHCQTKYQVTFEAIGSAGRKVQCAHCRRAWDQQPVADSVESDADKFDADQLFDEMAEDALDEAMAAEERAANPMPAPAEAKPEEPVASPARAPDAAEMKKRQVAFSRRQNAMISRLPLARLRRTARFLGVVILATIVGGGYLGREQIVERYPDLAGVYEAVGLGVNVVGLSFEGLETLKTLSGGNDVLMVSAQIVGLKPKPMPVPPIVVSLLDATGHAVYEWSVSPQVRDLMAGERATFDTRLSLPPSEAVHVRLSFAGGNMQSELRGDQQGGAEAVPVAPAEHSEPEADPGAHGEPAEPAQDHHAAPAETAHAAPEHH